MSRAGRVGLRARVPLGVRSAIVVFAIFTATGANNALSPIYVIYERRFGFSSLVVTAIFGIYAVAVLGGLVVLGRLSDGIGRRPLVLGGQLLLLTSTVIFLTATGTPSLYAGRAVLGVATAAITTAGAAALVELEPNHDRRRASLLTTLAFLSGGALGPLIAGAVAQFLPAPLTSPFIVELVLESAGFLGMVLVEEPADLGPGPLRWQLQHPSVPRQIRGPFALAGTVAAVGWMLGGFYGALSGTMTRQLLHVRSYAVAGVVIFLFAFTGGVTQLVVRHWSPRRAMAAGVLAAAAGIALVEGALFSSSAPLFLVATLATGAGNGLIFMGSVTLVNHLAPSERRAEVFAAYNVIAYLALALPVLGVGFSSGPLGLKPATLLFAVILGGICIVAFLACWRSRSRELAERTELAAARR